MSTATPHEESFFQDRRRLFAGLCQDFTDRLNEIIRKRRKASLALAGGTTPGPLYEALSNVLINWEKVSLTVTDERWVSPEDPASNEYLIRDLLMKRRAAGATFVPFQRISPASGIDRPARVRSSVVLPVPLAPVTISACPGSARSDRPANSRLFPRRAARSWVSSMGGGL